MEKSLNKKELAIYESFSKQISTTKRRTQTQYVIALVGLVGSGKKETSYALASKIGAIVIENDLIRNKLKDAKLSYDHVNSIAQMLLTDAMAISANVVLCSDFIDTEKQKKVSNIAKAFKASLYFLRTVRDFDITFGKIITDTYNTHDFFAKAESVWKGSLQEKGVVVKLREMFRRVPLHYVQSDKRNGAWSVKPLSFIDFTINTSNTKVFQQSLKDLVQTLK